MDGPGNLTLNKGFIWSGGRHGGTGQTIVPVNNFPIGAKLRDLKLDPNPRDEEALGRLAASCRSY